MRLKESGKGLYEKIIPKWNEVLFVDIWDNYTLYTECSCLGFDHLVDSYVDSRKRQISYFNKNYIKQIIKGNKK